MIKVNCPECNKAYSLKDNMAGKKVRCKECNTKITVPAAAAA